MATLMRFLALTLVVALIAPLRTEAQRRKLNGPLAVDYLSDVTAFDLANGRILYTENETDLLRVPLNGSALPEHVFQETVGFDFTAQLTPNGSFIVLYGDLESPNIDELFVLPANGSGEPTRLNAPLEPNRHVYSYRISPDSEWVVYSVAGSGAGSGLWGPYSVRTDGSQPAVSLNGSNFVQADYQITPDSARVLFRENSRLYTVPIAGGVERVRIHPALGGGRLGVPDFEIAPNGSRVVYRLDFDTAEQYELYSAPVDGSALQVKLNDPLSTLTSVARFQVSPYSTHVSYEAIHAGEGGYALYGVPIAGGSIVQFSPAVPARSILEERVSHDRSRMVYLANHDVSSRFDLYSVPVDGSQAPVNLTATIPGSGVSTGFLTDPVSGRVLFRATLTGGARALYSVDPYSAAPPVVLTPAGISQGVPNGGFAIASGSTAVFLADGDAPAAQELWRAPLDGSSAATLLHPPLVAGGKVYSFVLDSTGTRALYRAEQDFDNVIELFVVPVDGSAPPALRSAIREHISTVGDVDSFEVAPDGTTAVYRADQASGDGLYAVNLVRDPEPVWLAGPGGFEITADSQRVVYGQSSVLYGIPIDASTGPSLISSLPHLQGWWIAPDSSRVVHENPSDSFGDIGRLFSTPLLGGTTVELNTPRVLDGAISWTAISPDSSRVAYAGVQQTTGVIELYSAPLAGGAAPVKLSDALVAGGDVVANAFTEFPQISPDSSRVVYLADRDVNDAFELYSVPITGATPPTELSALPGSNRDVKSHATSPDSSRVVYVADQDADEVYELYSVPLAGGTPVELSAIQGADRDVDSTSFFPPFYSPFLISPDSQWVVYTADQDVNDAFEVYCAPLVGGSAPVRLTFDATTSTTTYLHRISPDSSRVVFVRDQAGVIDLFSAPLDGGSPPVRLNGPVSFTGGPGADFDASGQWILFMGSRTAGVEELFVAPIDGRRAPIRVGGPFQDVVLGVTGVFRPGTSSVVFRAEGDEAGVVELYISESRPRHRRAR